MPKKILICNTTPQNILYLNDLFNLLKNYEYALFFYSRDLGLKKYCQEQKFLYKKSPKLLEFDSGFFQTLFILLLILFWLFGFFLIFIFKLKYKIDTIICESWQEKILFTPWAKLLKQKIIWIECPGAKKQKLNILIRALIIFFHSRANIITFNQKTKDKLCAAKYKPNNITLIRPGINSNQHLRQENIFHDLARANNTGKKNNFYTIGAISDLDKDQEIEVVLGAVKKALSVIPNLQFIIIGEGKERKNLNWLAKKMEIGNLVWFVGEQTHLHKWLNSFNIFITAAKDASLNDIKAVLYAMTSGVPVITPMNHGFDDIINDNNGLLTETSNSEIFSGAIIKLNQDKRLADKLAQNAKKDVNEKYTDKVMMEEFVKILN